MENLLTIGEFAEATRISPKALRLYAEQGLLMPTRVLLSKCKRALRRLLGRPLPAPAP